MKHRNSITKNLIKIFSSLSLIISLIACGSSGGSSNNSDPGDITPAPGLSSFACGIDNFVARIPLGWPEVDEGIGICGELPSESLSITSDQNSSQIVWANGIIEQDGGNYIVNINSDSLTTPLLIKFHDSFEFQENTAKYLSTSDAKVSIQWSNSTETNLPSAKGAWVYFSTIPTDIDQPVAGEVIVVFENNDYLFGRFEGNLSQLLFNHTPFGELSNGIWGKINNEYFQFSSSELSIFSSLSDFNEDGTTDNDAKLYIGISYADNANQLPDNIRFISYRLNTASPEISWDNLELNKDYDFSSDSTITFAKDGEIPGVDISITSGSFRFENFELPENDGTIIYRFEINLDEAGYIYGRITSGINFDYLIYAD